MFEAHEEGEWRAVEPVAAVASLACLLGLFAVMLSSDVGWVPLLDSANLAFHEAGHFFFGIFGATLGLYGGTLGQLVFPSIALLKFAATRQPLGVAFSGVWFGENLVNVARYMADARAQLLPLVGGGEHDWANILGRWGALQHDTALARAVRVLGWLLMLGSAGWLLWRHLQGRQRAGGEFHS